MKLHIDIDAFFVSAHRTQNSRLKGIPVAVGGRSDIEIFSTKRYDVQQNSPNSGAFVPLVAHSVATTSQSARQYFTDSNNAIRGILTTASYEARALGIKTPMPIAHALRICPHLVLLRPDFELYHDLSAKIRMFLQKRIPVLEQFSIDEFFADVGGYIEDDDVQDFVRTLRDDILRAFDIPVSIGAAPSKWSAKLATTWAKPFGTKVLYAQDILPFVRGMNIEKFPGIGKKLALKFHALGYNTLGDIIDAKAYFARQTPSMQMLYKRICGTDNETVKSSKERKSVGVARTFDPIISRNEIRRRIVILCRHLSFTLHRYAFNPMHFDMRIGYEYSMSSKGHTKSSRIFSEKRFIDEMVKLFDSIDTHTNMHIKSIAIHTGAFTQHTHKATSLLSFEEDKKAQYFDVQLQKIRLKHGVNILKWGREMLKVT